jgi:hypothetical protein
VESLVALPRLILPLLLQAVTIVSNLGLLFRVCNLFCNIAFLEVLTVRPRGLPPRVGAWVRLICGCVGAGRSAGAAALLLLLSLLLLLVQLLLLIMLLLLGTGLVTTGGAPRDRGDFVITTFLANILVNLRLKFKCET